mmetsp:Transcript_33689/g.84577  ORF Transcript_33689/g.84577 Transcript_33689/m.84577 type:complete len:383 (-) Transcript_33689:1607-2755(-)
MNKNKVQHKNAEWNMSGWLQRLPQHASVGRAVWLHACCLCTRRTVEVSHHPLLQESRKRPMGDTLFLSFSRCFDFIFSLSFSPFSFPSLSSLLFSSPLLAMVVSVRGLESGENFVSGERPATFLLSLLLLSSSSTSVVLYRSVGLFLVDLSIMTLRDMVGDAGGCACSSVIASTDKAAKAAPRLVVGASCGSRSPGPMHTVLDRMRVRRGHFTPSVTLTLPTLSARLPGEIFLASISALPELVDGNERISSRARYVSSSDPMASMASRRVARCSLTSSLSLLAFSGLDFKVNAAAESCGSDAAVWLAIFMSQAARSLTILLAPARPDFSSLLLDDDTAFSDLTMRFSTSCEAAFCFSGVSSKFGVVNSVNNIEWSTWFDVIV